ncbi:MAG: hypothetical protein ACR2N4_18245 [Jatrophihabitans sp.]
MNNTVVPGVMAIDPFKGNGQDEDAIPVAGSRVTGVGGGGVVAAPTPLAAQTLTPAATAATAVVATIRRIPITFLPSGPQCYVRVADDTGEYRLQPSVLSTSMPAFGDC